MEHAIIAIDGKAALAVGHAGRIAEATPLEMTCHAALVHIRSQGFL